MHAMLAVTELRNILSNAMLFVSKPTSKDKVGLFDGVLLHELNGGLAALATDKYRMAEVLAEASVIEPGFRLFVTSTQAKTILEGTKPKPGAMTGMIRIERSDDEFSVGSIDSDVSVLRFEVSEDEAFKATHLHGGRRLFPADPTHRSNDHAMAHVSFEYLASFCQVKDHRAGKHTDDTLLLITAAEKRKPSVILRGDWFRGLLMPSLGRWPQAIDAHDQARFI